MDITRRKFLQLAGTAGLLLSFGKVHAASNEKILVAYFSRTGEEYGVGNITKGNTAIVAEIIAQKVEGDLFEIKPVTPYPDNYDECTKIASREKANKIRPPYVGDVENFSDYTTVFVGFPIWYGDAPQIVYTFLEGHDFSGKKIVPFCTHGGSGLSGTDQRFSMTCSSAKILQGFDVRGTTAQNDRSQAENAVENHLKKLGLL